MYIFRVLCLAREFRTCCWQINEELCKKNTWEEQKIPDRSISRISRVGIINICTILSVKILLLNFSFFFLSRDEKEKKNPAMSSTKLHRDAIMVTEVTRETTRDGGREVKTETILSKRILRAQVSSAFATKRKCARRGNRRNNWRTRRCTADRVPLFRLTGITALEHHGLLSLSSLLSLLFNLENLRVNVLAGETRATG